MLTLVARPSSGPPVAEMHVPTGYSGRGRLLAVNPLSPRSISRRVIYILTSRISGTRRYGALNYNYTKWRQFNNLKWDS